MRALFLTHAFPRHPGDAAGSFLLRLAQALAAEQVEVHVIAPAAAGLSPHDEASGIPVRRFRYAPRRLETLAYTGTMAQTVAASWSARGALVGLLAGEFAAALGAVRRFRPDIVHAHWWFPSGLAAAALTAVSRPPLVTTLHGTDVRLARSSGAAQPLFRYVMRRSAAVTTVSHWLADEAEAMAPGTRARVAPMPVDTERFSPAHEPRGDALLYVGRLNEQKGIGVLVEALARLRVPRRLDVVGEGPDGAALRARADALGITDRIHWHGSLSNDALPDWYRRAAAVVVPSTDEGLGLVAVEAQLCAAPVVAAHSGGLPDVVRDGETGVLVPPRDPAALAAALDALAERPDRGAALGEAGRRSAAAAFAPASAARRYATLYRDIVGQRSAA